MIDFNEIYLTNYKKHIDQFWDIKTEKMLSNSILLSIYTFLISTNHTRACPLCHIMTIIVSMVG